MCGIILIERLNGKSPVKMVKRKYNNQKSRGTDGFGLVSLKEGKVEKFARTEDEKDIMKKLDEVRGSAVLFHHRMPTSTPNYAECAHPIKVSHQTLTHDYYLAHNGIMHETDDYKAKHEALGFKYTTEVYQQNRVGERVFTLASVYNDSEALAVELAIDLDKNGEGIDMRGSVAFIMLQTDKEGKATKLFWGRNLGNPLMHEEIRDEYRVIASIGNGKLVPEHKLYEYDYATKTTSCRTYKVGVSYSYESGKLPMGYSRSQEDEVEVISDAEQKYYDLLEEYDELRKNYDIALSKGQDVTVIGQRLDDVEAAIAEYELSRDLSDIQIVDVRNR